MMSLFHTLQKQINTTEVPKPTPEQLREDSLYKAVQINPSAHTPEGTCIIVNLSAEVHIPKEAITGADPREVTELVMDRFLFDTLELADVLEQKLIDTGDVNNLPTPTMLEPPRLGTLWDHNSGRRYRVMMLVNQNSENEAKFPLTVIYADVTDPAKVWSRPLEAFLMSFQQLA